MNTQVVRDTNLIIIAAVEEYGLRHNMPAKDVLALFHKHNIVNLLRSQYEVLHTMDMSEGADFAESVLRETA